ncbi:hypothetical protein chiPu_0003877 [Chiloscyllium punctatum]|uniref:Serpin domain-containing protein n=1 Tax=Chiloscyllium punctatum TaxID=137246 RepID=A0A401S502_CHIPU|nr:hypothetical protein [Chiloscyllium punctatum]
MELRGNEHVEEAASERVGAVKQVCAVLILAARRQVFKMDSLTVANTKFAILLFKKLKEGKGNENIFLSPLSISTALAMVYLGAKGNTAAEMAKVLHFDTDEDVHPKFKELMAGINDRDKPYLLKLANRLFGEETHTFLKGQWSSKFTENKTYVKSFWLNKKESKPINMMFQEEEFYLGYIEELQTKVLELPYIQNELSMIILLPDSINDNSTGLEQLEQTLTYENLLLWTNQANMMKIKVRVHLPRFKLEDQFNLKDVLSAMGMTEAFDQVKANFTGMSETNNLFLSNVFHKSFVEVNEEGTEAAAGSAALISNRSLPLETEFLADHPFLFFIKHNKSESILFFGCFSSPGDEVRGYKGAQQMTQQVQRCK